MKSLYLVHIVCVFMSANVFSQKKAKKEDKFQLYQELLKNKEASKEAIDYKMKVYKPDTDQNQQINIISIDTTQKIQMPIYESLTSVLVNPKGDLSLGEISKKLKRKKEK